MGGWAKAAGSADRCARPSRHGGNESVSSGLPLTGRVAAGNALNPFHRARALDNLEYSFLALEFCDFGFYILNGG